MTFEEIKSMAKKRDLSRVEVEIDGEKAEFEVVDWSDTDLEDRKELLAYFFTFESDKDFEGMAGAAWLVDFLPFAITGDIDDDTHAEWDDIGGGGLLVKKDGSIHYFYHEMDKWPRQVASSLSELKLEWLPDDDDEEEDD